MFLSKLSNSPYFANLALATLRVPNSALRHSNAHAGGVPRFITSSKDC